MRGSAAFKLTFSLIFTYIAIIVGLSGALETYVLHAGGTTLAVYCGDGLQGLALILFVYQHVKIVGQPLSIQNAASVVAVIVGASGAVQAYFVHIGGVQTGLVAGSVLQGLALVLLAYQQLNPPPVPAAAKHG